jgi:hypothetical protein
MLASLIKRKTPHRIYFIEDERYKSRQQNRQDTETADKRYL